MFYAVADRGGILGVALVVALIATACGGGGESSEESDAARSRVGPQEIEAPPPNEYQRLVDEAMVADGPEPALQLFALQYGALPGVTVPDGDPGPAQTGTLAISAVFGVWDQVTAAQRTAILEALELPADFVPSVAAADEGETTVRGITVERAARPRATADATRYRESLDAVARVLERHLGPLSVPVEVQTSRLRVRDAAGRPALADALVTSGTCRIRVFPRELPPPEGPSATMAHELAHCYQQAWRGGVMPRSLWWVEEGGAEWAGNAANAEAGGGIDSGGEGFLAEWINTPRTALRARSYDAWGWFALVHERTGNLWSRFRELSTAGSTDEAVRAALGGEVTPAFASEWATSQAWRAPWGADWVVTGPGVTRLGRTLATPYAPITNGQRVVLESPALATARGAYRLRSQLVRFDAGGGTAGVVRVGEQDRAIESLTGQAWCLGEGQACVCPPGSRRAGQRFERLGGDQVFVAVSGGTQATQAGVTGRSLRDECGQAQCPVGTWRLDSPPRVPGVSGVTGGTGTIMTVSEDGAIVQDFSQYEPVEASDTESGITVYIAPTGRVTARIQMPANGRPFTSADVEAVDASRLGGTGWTESYDVDFGNRVRIDFTVDEIKQAVSGLTAQATAEGARVKITCPSPTELAIVAAGGISQTYVAVEEEPTTRAR